MKKLMLVIATMAACSGASARDKLVPTQGPLTPIGTEIRLDGLYCKIDTSRSMYCINLSEACVDFRAKLKADSTKTRKMYTPDTWPSHCLETMIGSF